MVFKKARSIQKQSEPEAAEESTRKWVFSAHRKAEGQTFAGASVAPDAGTTLSAPFPLCSREGFPLTQRSEASLEFPCGLGPCCTSFLRRVSLSDSFLQKSFFIFPFSLCPPSSHAAHFPLLRVTKHRLCPPTLSAFFKAGVTSPTGHRRHGEPRRAGKRAEVLVARQ